MKNPALYLLLITLYYISSNAQWVFVSQVNNIGDYPTISMADCNSVVIAGRNNNLPALYKSTNGGLNFTSIATTEVTRDIYSLWALNKDTIFAGDGGALGGLGGNANVYKTTNGGLNWTVILSTGGNSGFINGIVFERPAQNFGIIVSDPPLGTDSFWIAKTTNKGGTWNITRAPYVPQFSTQRSPFVIDSLFYGFGIVNLPPNTQSKIYITTNGGVSWNVRFPGLTANSVPSIAFQSNKLNGIAISDITLPTIALTNDGGLNWQSSSTGSGITGVGTVKWVPGTNIYFFCANKIKRTSNGGLTWEEMNTGGILNFVHMDLISTGPNSICAYVLAEDGKVLKYEGEPFGIKQISGEIPRTFELMQNYPNPFNPVTHLRFDISELSEGLHSDRLVKLVVNDVQGKLVIMLVNQQLQPGTYEVDFDGNNLPSGIYYYTLIAGDSSPAIRMTKKMVLIK